LRIDDPDAETRACYRRMIDAAKRYRLVPDGFRLRHTGRDRGDLIVRLSDDTAPDDTDWNRIRLNTRPSRHSPISITSGPQSDAPSGEPSAPSAAADPGLPGAAVMDRLLEAGGLLRIKNPDAAVRTAYRRAIASIAADDVPEGKRITYRGRDRGDLVIELVDKPDPGPSPPAPIQVPKAVNLDLPLLAHLAANPQLLDVSDGMRDRALRLVQALVEEGTRRGHETGPRDDGPSFELVIRGEAIEVTVREEKDKVTRVSDEDRAKVKYDWQRASPTAVLDWSGRLVMTMPGERHWADRKRWTLEGKLSSLLMTAESIADGRIAGRVHAERARIERREWWEDAVQKARAAYVLELNRGRLADQLRAHAHARDLRVYADAVTAQALNLAAGRERAAALDWAGWIRQEADRLDPLLLGGELMYLTPDEVPLTKLGPFMPQGMNAYRPPDSPRRW
jgi:hypothetical protein